jgi:hypothetical protein
MHCYPELRQSGYRRASPDRRLWAGEVLLLRSDEPRAKAPWPSGISPRKRTAGSGAPSAWRGERFAVERDQAVSSVRRAAEGLEVGLDVRIIRDEEAAPAGRVDGLPDPAVGEIQALEVEQLFVERLPRLEAPRARRAASAGRG